MQGNAVFSSKPVEYPSDTPSQVFGLRYLEEDAADILEVAGCHGVIAQDNPNDLGFTIKLCGDGFDVSAV